MKKLFIITGLLFTICGFSQHKAGLETGVSSSMFRNNFEENFSSRLSAFTVGLFHEYAFSSKWSIKSLISSQKKGFVVDDPSIIDIDFGEFPSGDIIFEETTIDYNFIVINPLLKFTTGNELQFFANVGPYYGFQTNDGTGTDFGITSGIGGQYLFNELTFSLEARNSLGLKKVFEFGNTKTNTYYLLAGAAYNL